MIKCNLLKLSFVLNFHNEKACRIKPNIFWYSKIRLCNKIKKNVCSFVPLINNSVTVALSYLVLSI